MDKTRSTVQALARPKYTQADGIPKHMFSHSVAPKTCKSIKYRDPTIIIFSHTTCVRKQKLSFDDMRIYIQHLYTMNSIFLFNLQRYNSYAFHAFYTA
jgi:hypothetical protein